jgi:hypothetical protein
VTDSLSIQQRYINYINETSNSTIVVKDVLRRTGKEAKITILHNFYIIFLKFLKEWGKFKNNYILPKRPYIGPATGYQHGN